MGAKLNQDRFYLNRENGTVEWVYHNPDSMSEGQFVHNCFDLALLQESLRGISDPAEAFDRIGSCCAQYLCDNGTEAYRQELLAWETDEPDAVGCTLATLKYLRAALLRAAII